MPQFMKVANVSDLSVGQGICVQAGGHDIAIFNLEGTFYAIGNTCPHAGGPLGEGLLEGEQVACPWHGASFNVKTGAVMHPPAQEGVASYKVRVSGSDIEVEI